MSFKNNSNILALGLGILLVVGLIWATNSFRPQEEIQENSLKVSASFYPLYFLASSIGGERVETNLIVPAGLEVHDYELTARDMTDLFKSHLVILNGGGLEPWQDNLENNLNSETTRLLIASEAFISLETEHDGELESDPHVWLDPILLSKIAEKITLTLQELDPEGSDYYQSRQDVLKAELLSLDQDYRQALSSCPRRDFIVSHAAFAYLASAYDLRQIPIAGLSPEAEPSLRELAELTNFARSNNVAYIFFEETANPALAETLAREIGAQTLVLNPLESLDPDKIQEGADYFSEMRQNLANLQVALDCQR